MEQERKQKTPNFLLPVIAAVVLIVTAAVLLIPQFLGDHDSEPSESQSLETQPLETQISTTAPSADIDGLVIQASQIRTEASYFDYDADGITVQVLAVRASDGTVRLALNTCQVCNGSPYAYFEQDGDQFICQNCKSRFASTEIGVASGGCRPVPITDEVYTEQDGTYIIPFSFLKENASLFKNWKKF